MIGGVTLEAETGEHSGSQVGSPLRGLSHGRVCLKTAMSGVCMPSQSLSSTCQQDEKNFLQ